LIDDPRDPAHTTHTVEDVLRARMLAIACGYPDGKSFTFSGPIQPSNSPADGFQIRAPIYARRQPFRAGRTRLR